MDIRPIRSDDDHRLALREVERLWGAEEDPRRGQFEVLTTLVEAYEDRYYPVPDADPIDTLHFAIGDMGHLKRNSPKFLAQGRERLKC